MVAITTDTHPIDRHSGPSALAEAEVSAYREPGGQPPARLLAFGARPAAASGGHPLAPEALVRVLAVVAAIVVVLAVAVGTAAMGRVLDTQRGIPASAPSADVAPD